MCFQSIKTDCLEHPIYFNIMFMGRSILAKVASLGTTHDVNQGMTVFA